MSQEAIVEILGKDILYKCFEQLSDLSNVTENNKNGLISRLQIKNQWPIKLTVNYNKKYSY